MTPTPSPPASETTPEKLVKQITKRTEEAAHYDDPAVSLSYDQANRAATLLRTLSAVTRERDEALAKIASERPRKCAATISTDPPQDCDFPFCGCDPNVSKAMDILAECGWLPHREADELRRERDEARRILAEIAPIMRAEHDAGDGHFSTDQVERAEALSRHRQRQSSTTKSSQ